jgi:hypothetical protein
MSSVELYAPLDFRYRVVHESLGLDSMPAFVLLCIVKLALGNSQRIKRRLHMRLVRVTSGCTAGFGASR